MMLPKRYSNYLKNKKRLIKMDCISSSQINLYLLCGLKYKYQYVDKLPKPFKTSAYVFGSALYSSLAWFHQKRLKEEKISIGLLNKIFDSDWYSQTIETEIQFKEGEQEANVVSMAKEFLTKYLENIHIEVKAYEIPYRVPLVDLSTGEIKDIQIEGFIKLIETEDTIVDFKISAYEMSKREVRRNLKLTASSYAFQMLYNKLPRCVKMVNFIKDGNRKLSIVETEYDKNSYKRFFYLVNSVLKGIRSKIFVPHCGHWCADCEYASICPLQKHLHGERTLVNSSTTFN